MQKSLQKICVFAKIVVLLPQNGKWAFKITKKINP